MSNASTQPPWSSLSVASSEDNATVQSPSDHLKIWDGVVESNAANRSPTLSISQASLPTFGVLMKESSQIDYQKTDTNAGGLSAGTQAECRGTAVVLAKGRSVPDVGGGVTRRTRYFGYDSSPKKALMGMRMAADVDDKAERRHSYMSNASTEPPWSSISVVSSEDTASEQSLSDHLKIWDGIVEATVSPTKPLGE